MLPASASAALTATKIRIGSHTGFVRVVVDFTGGTITGNNVELAAGTIDPTGRARLEITKAGAMTTAADDERERRARLGGAKSPPACVCGSSVDAARFKFLGYRVMHSPERLVDRPLPARVARARSRVGGCLKIGRTTTSTPGRVMARGTVAADLREHVPRASCGAPAAAVVAAKTVTTATATGPWSTVLRHSVAPRQTGAGRGVVLLREGRRRPVPLPAAGHAPAVALARGL